MHAEQAGDPRDDMVADTLNASSFSDGPRCRPCPLPRRDFLVAPKMTSAILVVAAIEAITQSYSRA